MRQNDFGASVRQTQLFWDLVIWAVMIDSGADVTAVIFTAQTRGVFDVWITARLAALGLFSLSPLTITQSKPNCQSWKVQVCHWSAVCIRWTKIGCQCCIMATMWHFYGDTTPCLFMVWVSLQQLVLHSGSVCWQMWCKGFKLWFPEVLIEQQEDLWGHCGASKRSSDVARGGADVVLNPSDSAGVDFLPSPLSLLFSGKTERLHQYKNPDLLDSLTHVRGPPSWVKQRIKHSHVS